MGPHLNNKHKDFGGFPALKSMSLSFHRLTLPPLPQFVSLTVILNMNVLELLGIRAPVITVLAEAPELVEFTVRGKCLVVVRAYLQRPLCLSCQSFQALELLGMGQNSIVKRKT